MTVLQQQGSLQSGSSYEVVAGEGERKAIKNKIKQNKTEGFLKKEKEKKTPRICQQGLEMK